MDMKRVSQAESLIRGEAIRFMSHQQFASTEANLEMVLAEQPVEAPPAEPVPPFAPAPNLIDELCKKYGFSRPEPPVIVIASQFLPLRLSLLQSVSVNQGLRRLWLKRRSLPP